MKKLLSEFQQKEVTRQVREERLMNAIEEEKAVLQAVQAKIKELERLQRLVETENWIDDIVTPLANMLAVRTGLHVNDLYGPFGTRAEVTIYLTQAKDKGITEQDTYRLTVYPEKLKEGILTYQTTQTRSGKPHEYVLDPNGYNWVTANLPDDIDEIVKLLVFTPYVNNQ